MQVASKFVVAGLILGAAVVPVQAGKEAASAPKKAATIINTGSTNTTGYMIIVQPSGHVRYDTTPGTLGEARLLKSGHINKTQAQKFFADIAAASPLDKLPVTHQMKSVSFGTSTYLEYGGKRTPDLSAPADSRGQALQSDIEAIASSLKLKNGPRRPFAPAAPAGPGQ